MLRQLRATLIMLGECVSMSVDNIRGNKVRSFLTLLGIMIGVTAVITLISTVSGVSGSIAFDATGDAVRDTAYIKAANTETGVWDFVAVQGVN